MYELEEIGMNTRQPRWQLSMQMMLYSLVKLVERRLIRYIAGINESATLTGHHIVMSRGNLAGEEEVLAVDKIQVATAANLTNSHVFDS